MRKKYGLVIAPKVVEHLTTNPHITISDFMFLRSVTNLPIIVKGVLHPQDADMLIDYGADGIIVSNHGGRHLDGAVASLQALPTISEVVRDRIPVLFDSGIRHGCDIFKALSLGAKMVFIGRPFVYGLAVDGETGVRKVMENLIADFDLNLGIAGVNDVKKLNQEMLVHI